MSQQGKLFKQRYYRNIKNLASVGPCYFQVTSNLNMSQHGEEFKQLYYRNNKNLRLCRPELLSGNLQSEHIATGVRIQTMILSEH